MVSIAIQEDPIAGVAFIGRQEEDSEGFVSAGGRTSAS